MSLSFRTRPPFSARALAAAGSVLAGLAVALAAYASHAAGPEAGSRLGLAAAFAFGHGLALAALAPRAHGAMARTALWLLFFGVLLFAGSLSAAHAFGASTAAAPLGGGLMILGWLAYAAAALRG